MKRINFYCIIILLLGVCTAYSAEIPQPKTIQSDFLWEKLVSSAIGIIFTLIAFAVKRIYEKYDNLKKEVDTNKDTLKNDNDSLKEKVNKEIDEIRAEQSKNHLRAVETLNSETTMIRKEITDIKTNFVTKEDFKEFRGEVMDGIKDLKISLDKNKK